MRPPDYVEGVMVSSCAVDGDDVNDVIAGMVRGSRFQEQVRAIMLDGAAMGGFNVIDVKGLSHELGLPVITISRDPPDLGSISSALKAHFQDWERRYEIISSSRVRPLELPEGRIFIASEGIAEEEADQLVTRCIVRGRLPEPVRLAHIIATAIVRGESRGRA